MISMRFSGIFIFKKGTHGILTGFVLHNSICIDEINEMNSIACSEILLDTFQCHCII